MCSTSPNIKLEDLTPKINFSLSPFWLFPCHFYLCCILFPSSLLFISITSPSFLLSGVGMEFLQHHIQSASSKMKTERYLNLISHEKQSILYAHRGHLFTSTCFVLYTPDPKPAGLLTKNSEADSVEENYIFDEAQNFWHFKCFSTNKFPKTLFKPQRINSWVAKQSMLQ